MRNVQHNKGVFTMSVVFKLQSQVNPETGELSLTEEDVQSIQNYVSESGNGSASESLQQLLEKISGQNAES
jgi:hypothetical protein